MTSHADDRFPITRWTLVERAGDGQLQVRRLALEELLRLYWPALQARVEMLPQHGERVTEWTNINHKSPVH